RPATVPGQDSGNGMADLMEPAESLRQGGREPLNVLSVLRTIQKVLQLARPVKSFDLTAGFANTKRCVHWNRRGASMKKTVRFAVSLDHHLLDDLDRVLVQKKYETRSEAIRDLIRDHLVADDWDKKKEAVG